MRFSLTLIIKRRISGDESYVVITAENQPPLSISLKFVSRALQNQFFFLNETQ
jgi:hypothetical protein